MEQREPAKFGVGPNTLRLVDGHGARIVDKEATVLVDVIFQFELAKVARCRCRGPYRLPHLVAEAATVQ